MGGDDVASKLENFCRERIHAGALLGFRREIAEVVSSRDGGPEGILALHFAALAVSAIVDISSRKDASTSGRASATSARK